MMFCLDVPAVVDRVEDAVAVVEIAGGTLDLPGAASLREGDTLTLATTVQGLGGIFPDGITYTLRKVK